MGTPDFAVASLDALVKSNFNIVGVITAPDKPAGRGQKVQESSVKKYAVANGLKILQPHKLKDPIFIEELTALEADLQVVVAFRMLPEIVWNMPPKGTINLHASLLPQYRGAAPINWAIINGESQTGVTTFFLKHEIDTGDILFTKQTDISEDESAGDLHDKLMIIGAELLVQTVKSIEIGDYQEIPQPEAGDRSQESEVRSQESDAGNHKSVIGIQISEMEMSDSVLKHAPKLFKENCLIDWVKPVIEVYNLIRGLSPYPTSYTHFQNKTLKIFKVELEKKEPGIQPGGFLSDGKSFLKFACPDGFIFLKEIQWEGKKRMGIEEFLRGIRL